MLKINCLFLIISCLFYVNGRIIARSTAEVEKPNLEWWQDTIFYQIYPRSFKDTDGDGIGDLKGITEKLAYLKESGINGTWLSPIFKSPMVDFGYDISDFNDIQPEYGTMKDFEELIREANRLDIKIILDFVPNHSSDQHKWFEKSIKREPGYENFYIWHPGKILENGTRVPPNNWISIFTGPAWEWNEERQEYYYHTFTVQQPDLNFRDPLLVEAMKDVLRFWMDKGVYGFRVDAVPHLVEQDHLKDEPLNTVCCYKPNEWGYLDHIYTVNQPENYEVIRGWRETLDEYSRTHDNVSRVMMTEVYADVATSLKYYDAGASFSFNFGLVNNLKKDSTAKSVSDILLRWLNNVPSNYTSNWVMGNHDNNRVATNSGPDRVDGINMMLLILPGIGVTYNGEEIGMENGHLTWEQHQDTTCIKEEFDSGKCRDFERTPFQWDDSHMAGFTTGNNPWLPVDPSYKKLNLKLQQEAKESHWKVYKAMAELRKTDILRYGNCSITVSESGSSLIINRIFNETDMYSLVFNLGLKFENVRVFNTGVGQVIVRSSNVKDVAVGDAVDLENVPVNPNEAFVLKRYIKDQK